MNTFLDMEDMDISVDVSGKTYKPFYKCPKSPIQHLNLPSGNKTDGV